MKKIISSALVLTMFLSLSCGNGQDTGKDVNVDVKQQTTAKKSAGSINEDESNRLKSFIKKRFGARLPADATIEVKGYDKSSIEGFKDGTFIITSTGGSGDVPFLISQDGKYLIFGEPISTEGFKSTTVKGLKQGQITMGNQPVPVLMSDDGQHIIMGSELMDITVDPGKETMSKISLEDVPVKGSKDAEVTVVEYSDFQCPFCSRASAMLPDILDEYKGKIKVVYKQFPLPNHNWAKPAAIASVCAYRQSNDKFWDFHDKLFNQQKEVNLENSDEKFNAIAKDIGLDSDKFGTCLKSPEVAARVDNEMQEARSVGVNSTPTFIVDGIVVPGADPQSLKSAIETSLSQGS